MTKRKIYDYIWGAGVVESFDRKYGRAVALVSKMYNISTNDLIYWVTHEQTRWEKFKTGVKNINKVIDNVHFPQDERLIKQRITWSISDELSQMLLAENIEQHIKNKYSTHNLHN